MALRVVVFLAPLAATWLVLTIMGSALWRPDGFAGLLMWIVQAIAVGLLVSRITGRATRRILPLASLLSLTLVFPDEAPSRFGTALRAGTLHKMTSRIEQLEENGLGPDANSAAREAIELVGFLSAHDPQTRGHTERVRAYAELIATEMGIDQTGRERLAWSVLLHDVGKLMVPFEILNKETKLEPEEWEILKAHPAKGQQMLLPLAEWLGEWDGAAAEHHERWDGDGYPNGLAGTQISLAGRITAVADAYDVITSTRSYKQPMTADAARRELVRCSGSQFDPDVVRAMVSVSLGERRGAGPFAFLTETPRVLDIARAATSAPTAVLVPAAVVALAATTLPPSSGVPDELSFAPTTTTIAQGTTVGTSNITVTTFLAPTSTVAGPNEPTATLPVTTPTSAGIPTTTSAEPTTTGVTAQPPSTQPIPPTTSTATRPTSTAAAPASTTTEPSAPATMATTTTTAEPTTTTTTAPPPNGPVTMDDDVSVNDDTDIKIEVLENDSDGASPMDPSTLTIVTDPEHAASFRVHESGDTFHIHYKSKKGYEGPDSIVYSVCDLDGDCSTAVINITVS